MANLEELEARIERLELLLAASVAGATQDMEQLGHLQHDVARLGADLLTEVAHRTGAIDDDDD